MPHTLVGTSQFGGGAGSTGGGGAGTSTTGSGGSGVGNILSVWALIAGEVVKTFNKPAAPFKLRARDIVGLARASADIQRRGFTPRISQDPFSGDFVASRQSQEEFLEELLLERAISKAGIPVVGRDPEDPFGIGGLAQRGEVRSPQRPLEDFPVLFEGARPVSAANPVPGLVTRGGRLSSKRLSGPCAGVVSGIARLRCSRGRGFR